jgi:hypothetical protein
MLTPGSEAIMLSTLPAQAAHDIPVTAKISFFKIIFY